MSIFIYDYGGGLRHRHDAESLRGADLRDADLMCAVLKGCDLTGADLRGADLRGIRLRGAVLTGVKLAGAQLNWSCRELIGEILRQAAGADPARLDFAERIKMDYDKCWPHWVGVGEPCEAWALGVLGDFVLEDDHAPFCVRAAGAGKTG